MAEDKIGIDERAKDGMAVAPDKPESEAETAKRQKETSIEERLDRNPESEQARLDEGLDESMDASDPPATTQPVHSHSREPAPSSGYDEEAEKKRKG